MSSLAAVGTELEAVCVKRGYCKDKRGAVGGILARGRFYLDFYIDYLERCVSI